MSDKTLWGFVTQVSATMGDRGEDEIVYRELDTDREYPAVQIAEIVAELEGRNVGDLTSTYDCVDHVLENVLSEPPSPEAQLQVTFSYEGYRITVEHDGSAAFAKLH